MAWKNFWAARRQTNCPANAEDEDTIDDEMLFHFRAMLDENMARGMAADAAWSDAQRRFGSLRRYADECGRIFPGGYRMLQNISAAGMIVLTLIVGWLFSEVRSLRQAAAAGPSSSQLRPIAQRAKGAQQKAKSVDLAGTVVDKQGKAIAGAHVLVILKTWPGGRYRQQDFATKTDDAGQFRFKELVTQDGQRGIHLAVVKDGYALKSMYELKKAGEKMKTEGLSLKLDDAARMTIVVRDAQGTPVPKAAVIPSERQTGSEEHLVYFQAAKPLEAATDDEGRVRVDLFRRGDRAKLYIRLPGKEWEEREITIPAQGDQIDVSL